ncbi:MAG: DUF1552 domain-containing protein, partial [Opitutae bacterium]
MNLNPIHRRAALKQLGLSTLSLPILTQSSSLFGEPEKKSIPKQRLIVMFSPNGTIPNQFWPERDGEDFEHKTILKPLELFPGNVMGGGNTPSGWPKGISIDREICKHLQSKP